MITGMPENDFGLTKENMEKVGGIKENVFLCK